MKRRLSLDTLRVESFVTSHAITAGAATKKQVLPTQEPETRINDNEVSGNAQCQSLYPYVCP